MGLHYEQIVKDRLGERDGGVLLRTFDRQGWAIVNKGELQALRRAAARLDKSNSNGHGTKTGRMSMKAENLSQAPRTKTGKVPPVAVAEKLTKAKQAQIDRAKATATNKRAVKRTAL